MVIDCSFQKITITLKANICYQTIFFFVTFCGKSNQKPRPTERRSPARTAPVGRGRAPENPA